ncbi:MAG: hypothetical protein J3R72DRAFT_490313 [Linnemannia gamsii]|nr:MAG: hypothetical protein J3R72DRAFT_490313 [Linnemannia gamsii]
MTEFARTDTSFSAASALIADLNLNSTARIDVPDFGRCMDALKLLTNSLYKDLNGRQGLLAHVVYPGIKKGFKSPFGLVRFGFVAVLAHAVKRSSTSQTCQFFASRDLTTLFLKSYFKLVPPHKVETEKILVHTVIAILDDFHFDIKDVEVSSEEALFIKSRMLILIIKNLNLSTSYHSFCRQLCILGILLTGIIPADFLAVWQE